MILLTQTFLVSRSCRSRPCFATQAELESLGYVYRRGASVADIQLPRWQLPAQKTLLKFARTAEEIGDRSLCVEKQIL
jgi:hypothetical protein